MEKQIKDEKFDIADILSISWDIFKQNLKSILFITLIICIPLNIILYFAGLNANDTKSLSNYMQILRFLEGFIGIIVTIGIAFIVENSLNGTNLNWKDAINKSFTRWPAAILTNIIAGFIILGLLFLLIVPGIIWSLYYTFGIYVVVLRGLKGKKALDYSKSLVKDHWWEVFGILLVFGMVNLLIVVPIIVINYFLPGSTEIITNTLADIASAFFIVANTVFFLNLDYLKNPSTQVVDQEIVQGDAQEDVQQEVTE